LADPGKRDRQGDYTQTPGKDQEGTAEAAKAKETAGGRADNYGRHRKQFSMLAGRNPAA